MGTAQRIWAYVVAADSSALTLLVTRQTLLEMLLPQCVADLQH